MLNDLTAKKVALSASYRVKEECYLNARMLGEILKPLSADKVGKLLKFVT